MLLRMTGISPVMRSIFNLILFGPVLFNPFTTAFAQDLLPTLPISGRVLEADKKLEGCQIIIFKENEVVGEQLTDRSGRFAFELGLQQEFAMEFRKAGYLPKRVLVDTRGQLPKQAEEVVPIDLTMTMLPSTKYAGADTDELDFPFAIIRYDRASKAFVQDDQYTVDMMRTNGALLLMSGRATKR